MRIGLLDTLAPKAMAFWEAFAGQLELEQVKPTLTLEASLELGRQTLPSEASYVQLAVGRLLEMQDSADLCAIPLLEPEIERETSSPWLTDFGSVYARRLSFPRPVDLTVYGPPEALERNALTRGQEWTHSIGLVRKALNRTSPMLKAKFREPEMERAGHATIAVLGFNALLEQPFLLGELPAQLGAHRLFPVYSSTLERSKTLEYSARVNLNLALEMERGVAGAMAMLEGKAPLRGFVFAVATGDTSGHALARRLQERARKPALTLEVSPEKLDLDALEEFSARVSVNR
ncbi:MAG: hypothetical protein H7095_02035 [Pseudopedobacter sp.]|nr:hypothetical protein [Deinococcales bacterium]